MNYKRGIVAAILSSITSAVATVFLSGATHVIPPLMIAAYGAIVGSVGLVFLSTKKHPSQEISPERLRTLLIRISVIKGFCCPILFIIGVSLTEGIRAVFFTKIEPYFVMAWAWLRHKESASPAEIFLLAIHLIGALLVSTRGEIHSIGASQIGDLLIVVTMLLSSFSYTDSKILGANLGGTYSAGMTGVLGGVGILLLALWVSPPAIPTLNKGWIFFGIHMVLWHMISHPLWYRALGSLKSWIVSALRAIGPLAGAPVAYLLLGEKLNRIQLVGGAIVLITSACIGRIQFNAYRESDRKKFTL